MIEPEVIYVPFFEPAVELIKSESLDDRIELHRTYIEVSTKVKYIKHEEDNDLPPTRLDIRWMIIKRSISSMEVVLSGNEDCYIVKIYYGMETHSSFSFERKSDAMILYNKLQKWLVDESF